MSAEPAFVPSDPDPVGFPSVSVVIPTRDRPEPLRQAVRSVLGQRYEGDIECVVTFDQSEPALPDVELSSGRRLRAVVNTRTPGLAGARNSGGLAASGDLLAFLDDDDEWLPDKLQLQVEVLKRTPDAVVVGCGIFVRWNGRLIARVPPNRPVTFRELLASRRMELHSSTVLFRRSDLVERIGLVDESLPGSYSEDYEWLLRAARVGPIAVVPRPLATINWSASSYFSGRWEMIASALSSLLERYPEFHEVPHGLARVQGQIAFALASAGQRRQALAWVGRCAKSNWREPRAYLAAAVVVGLPADLVLKALHRTGRGI